MTDKSLMNHGYSIPDVEERGRWRALIEEVRQRVAAGNLEEVVLFHGTSQQALERILLDGMEPVDCSQAMPPTCRDVYEHGSFWGSIDTAAAYADDTASERHPDSLPVIIAIRVSTLEDSCRIVADGATVDWPLKGLTRLDDPKVAAYWSDFGIDRSWHESLRDLGAVVALHDLIIPAEDMTVIRSIEDLESFLDVSLNIGLSSASICP
jgi:hypothetical protein